MMAGLTDMGAWLRNVLRHLLSEITMTRATYTRTWSNSRPLTAEERAAIDRAFDKFDEGFREVDKIFDGWRT